MSRKDKWQPDKLDRKAVVQALAAVRGQTNAVERDFSRNSICVDLSYGKLMEAVESLYSLMDVGALAQDNQRRYQEHKRKVKR